MYDRFTDRSRWVMQCANQEAQRFHHEYIGTEHVLLALVKESAGVAARALQKLGVSAEQVEAETLKIVERGPSSWSVVGKLPNTPRVKKVIEYALDEARLLQHGQVGTEHLMLGILRDKDCVAALVLTYLVLPFSQVRQEVLSLLDRPPVSECAVADIPIVLGARVEEPEGANARSYDLHLPVGETPQIADRVARRLMELIAGPVLLTRAPMQSLSRDGKRTSVVVVHFVTDATEESRSLVMRIKAELMAELSLDHLLVVETEVRRL